MSDNYEDRIRSFEALAKAAFRASETVQGETTVSTRSFVGSYLFGRISACSIAMLKLCPGNDLATGPIQIHDIPGTATLARALIDNFYSFFYFASEAVEDDERDFRILLAEHSAGKQRLRMLRRLGAEPTEDETKHVEIAREHLVSNSFFQTLTPEYRQKLIKEGKPRHLDYSQMNQRLGIDQGYFRATWDYLSAELHALPYSFFEGIGRNLRKNPRAKEERLALILHHASLFLSLSLSQFCDLFQSARFTLSESTIEIIRERKEEFISNSKPH